MAMDLKQLVKEEEEENYDHDACKCKCQDRENHHQMDSSFALQSFLDHIPITPILSISSSVVELKSNDFIRDAIGLLYTKNVLGAPIVDNVDSDLRKFVDRDIGFIEFSSMVLWSLEEVEKARVESKCDNNGFLSMLEQNPEIGQTKIGELAKSFLWEPFFPVNSNDTLFHVMLLFSKHPRLRVIPVVESSNSRVVGFVNQNAVVQLLLQSHGLDWFDQIADKTIAEFGFEKAGKLFCVYEDQSISDVLHVLWQEQADGVPVVERRNETLIGVIRCRDIHRLLENDNIFNNRKSLTLEELIKTSSDFLPHANTLATNRKSDSLKQAMKSLVASNSSQSFLVDESGKLEGILTIRDIISQFSPPSLDSRIDGGGFFQAALEQAGCHVEDGSLVCNH